jgi:hypothetical protein
MPQIGIYLEPEYEEKLQALRKEGETKQDTATRLLKEKIDEER